MGYLIGGLFDWREMAFIGAAMSVPFLIAMCKVPEAPRWLINKGK